MVDKKGRIDLFVVLPAALIFVGSLFLSSFFASAGAGANLDQCRNGGFGQAAVDPCVWVNGNLNANQAHYTEGESIAYRAVVSGLSLGEHELVIGYDIKHGGKHAIDYITTYDRINEVVAPCSGVSGCGGSPNVFDISSFLLSINSISTPNGQEPRESIRDLPAGDRTISIWNGTITDITFISQGDLNASQSETTVRIRFNATNPTVVLAWGGHIASSLDWGSGAAAGNISGSPYHMRLQELDGSGGNQDRSLTNAQVTVAPAITISKSASPASLPLGGGQVTYTYRVGNGGNSSVATVSVTDNKCSPLVFGSGDTDGDNRLDVTEIWTYTCTTGITQTTTNTAIANGTSGGVPVNATAQATVSVTLPPPAPPLINIVKTASPTSLPASGGQVTYSYAVTNPGTTPLTSVTVADNKCSPLTRTGGDANNDSKLDPSETWRYSCTKTITTTTTNTATSTSVTNGITVIDTAQATVQVATPSAPVMSVAKSASPGSLPSSGGSVTYSYTLTNPGTVALSSITITDNTCSPLTRTGGDTNNNNILETTETWTYRCTKTVATTTTNIVTVRGTGNGQTASSTARATVTVAPPQVTVLAGPLLAVAKSASPTSLPAGGGQVTYTYTLTNPGTVSVSGITVADNKCSPLTRTGGDTNNNNILETTETWVYRCTASLTQTTSNTVTVTGTANGQSGSATAQTTVSVAVPGIPAIAITKTASPSSLSSSGGSVVYTYQVTNPGAVALSGVTVADNTCSSVSRTGGDTNNNNILETTETWAYSCSRQVTQTTTNIATASATGSGQSVSATAQATVTVASANQPQVFPRIDIVKSASPASLPPGGGVVNYFYVVTNPGTVALGGVSVIDNLCQPVVRTGGDTNQNNLLDPTETWAYSCSRQVTQTTTNVATARGSAGGQSASDQALATVQVAPLDPSVSPTINVIVIPNPGTLPLGGGTVNYTYRVTTPGTLALENITLTDDVCVVPVYAGGDTDQDNKLDPNETWVYTCQTRVVTTTTNMVTARTRTAGITVSDTARSTVVIAPVLIPKPKPPAPAPAPKPVVVLPKPPKTGRLLAFAPLVYTRTAVLPWHLTIPSLNISTSIESVGLTAAGFMNVPNSLDTAAWFNQGSAPGEVGNAVLAGHIGNPATDKGVFWNLERTQNGDEIIVERAGHEYHFVVTNSVLYKKDEVPTELVFGASNDANLNLITCAGEWDPLGRDYSDRLVVFARLINAN